MLAYDYFDNYKEWCFFFDPIKQARSAYLLSLSAPLHRSFSMCVNQIALSSHMIWFVRHAHIVEIPIQRLVVGIGGVQTVTYELKFVHNNSSFTLLNSLTGCSELVV